MSWFPGLESAHTHSLLIEVKQGPLFITGDYPDLPMVNSNRPETAAHLAVTNLPATPRAYKGCRGRHGHRFQKSWNHRHLLALSMQTL